MGNRFKLNWILELDTKEVKNWWKLLSYVPIYQLSHRSDNNNINILIDEAYIMEDKGSTDSEDEIYTKVPLLGKEHNDLSYLQSELGYDSKITYPEPEPTYFSILNE